MASPHLRCRQPAAILLALVLAACSSSTPTAYQPRNAAESQALQLAKAADLLGLRDAEIPKDAGAPGGGSTLPGSVAFGALNYLSPPPGFTPTAAGALGFASFFFSGPAPEEASQTSRLLVWMPRTGAATADEAWRTIDGMVQRELAAVLADTPLPPGHRLEKEERAATSYRPGRSLAPTPHTGTRTTWRIRGGDCDEPKVQCRYELFLPVPPVEDAAPAMLGGYPAWSYVRTEGLSILPPSFLDRRSFRETRRAVFPDLEVLRKLSARLPPWMAIYLAPNSVSHLDAATGKPVLLRYPVVLRGGEPLYFVRGT